ncbi:MAG: type II secretion system F family protein [Candidatus Omnitrophica bacterium]|nr:type II secretion system F family protein [Candidatus Omnitrophota bacterium]
MAQFSYKVKVSPSETQSGVIEADTQEDAVTRLLARGYTPLAVSFASQSAESPGPAASLGGVRIPLKALCDFFRQLADLVDAGGPLLKCLDILKKSVSSGPLRAVIGEMKIIVQGGESLSAAMARYPRAFSALHVQMVRSAEASGSLPVVLERLTELSEQDLKLRSRVLGSLMYPGIVFGVGILTVFVLLTVVMPKLTLFFEDFDAELPWPTQMMIQASSFMASYWWAVALVAAGAFIAGYRALQSSRGRLFFDTMILKVYILKDFIRQVETSRAANALATLLEGGVPIVTALAIVTDLISNTVIREDMADITSEVRAGSSLSAALRKRGGFWPEAAVSMISVGEEGGRLEKSLYKLAAMLDRETSDAAGVFTTLLGPVVLLFVVGIVGVMVLSVLLPLFQMNMLIK